MKSQKVNEGILSNLNVEIEEQIIEDFKLMSKNTEISVADLVAVALKRYRSSHADYMDIDLDFK